MVNAADVCAANPCHEVRRAIFIPTVSIIRQPPKLVPMPIVRAQTSMIQNGISKTVVGAARQHGEGEDTHEFLPVVEAVIERHEGCRKQLQPIKGALGRRAAPGRQRNHKLPD